MTNEQIKELCLNLMRADTEEEVVTILQEHGFWEDPSAWRCLGDEAYNYSSVGNQQSMAEQAIAEKLINSVDAKLICEARLRGYLPKVGSDPLRDDIPTSIGDAMALFFPESGGQEKRLGITVAATAKGLPTQGHPRPSFTIVDDGEGQTPARMPDTILSLHKGNKDKIKFAQGKFNMGGTGVLEFCGMEHNLQLVVSKRHPELIEPSPSRPEDGDWSLTVVRREDPSEGKSSRYVYLAPKGCDTSPNEGQLLHFTSESLAIFPEGQEPYARESRWGTLIKLYQYEARRFRTNMMLEDGLMYRARLMLPEPALPIRFYECRGYRGGAASFETTMPGLLRTLKEDYESESRQRQNVEWHDKLEFHIGGERFTADIFLFKNKDAADSYRKSEGVVFTYNGQCHATMRKDFFRRKKVGHDYLRESLLVFVDCSEIGPRSHERLFMNSRDRLCDGELTEEIISGLETQLGEHNELKRRGSERRRRALSENREAPEVLAQAIESILSRNPALANLLGAGVRITNPHRPEGAGESNIPYRGKRFPTRFHFKDIAYGEVYKRRAHLGDRVRLEFETDAKNDYFSRDNQPGSRTLFQKTGDGWREATDYYWGTLSNGVAHLTFTLPEGADIGDILKYKVEVTDASRPVPFVCELELTVARAVQNRGGGGGNRRNRREPNTEGSNRNRPTSLNIPDPQPIHRAEWGNQEPPFDRDTAMKIVRAPQSGEHGYDFFINMDNVHLETYLKQRPRDAEALKLKFSVSMTLVTLSLLHEHKQRKPSETTENPSEGGEPVEDWVANTTKALAPFLLPMIDGVSNIRGADDETPDESADEAA